MMENKEKARLIAAALNGSDRGKWLVEKVIEHELNRLDNPVPKKWEPRAGLHGVLSDAEVYSSRIPLVGNGARVYPTREEAEAAAPLHRKLDRLVNWMIQHCPDICTDDIIIGESGMGSVTVIFDRTENNELTTRISSGEVEL